MLLEVHKYLLKSNVYYIYGNIKYKNYAIR